MSLETTASTHPAAERAAVLRRLRGVADERGLPELAMDLEGLARLVASDLAEVEDALAALPRSRDIVAKSVTHLIGNGGKRLRPLCVALASRLGTGFDSRAKDLAVAVELVHNATLLHDDVVDVGDLRRGAPSARTLYGNAASIFAGDWLLVDALRRVRRANVLGTLDSLLEVIDEMIVAEAVQLENRERLSLDRATYFRIVEGKTAALFRWALAAGGAAGGLDDASCRALGRFGHHLGVAFQAIDDVLDLAGDPELTGKALFADLREGKMTYPLIVGVEREPALGDLLQSVLANGGTVSVVVADRILGMLRATDATRACHTLAQEHTAEALSCLEALPAGEGRDALQTIAVATASRSR